MTTCSGCSVEGQPEGARFCFSCGAPLGRPTCTACGSELVVGARFCSGCGRVQEAGGAAAAPPASPSVYRKITSVLFGDLVGFTALSETRDSEETRELLTRYFDECRQIVARYGGTVEKFIGDAVMAVWGVPTTHEDDAERAVRAGVELVNRVSALGCELGLRGLALRVGIVTGEVAVTVGATQQGMVAGDAVNTAARVQAAAEPGEVWVDDTTRLLSASAISFTDRGSHLMKGKAEPVPLWSVRAVVAAVGGAQRADGLEAPHIGRDRELRLVKELFHAAEESGRPSLLVVDGDAGLGKSRLGWEFEKYVDGLSTGAYWHAGRCVAYGEGVAFFALAEAVRSRLQLATIAAGAAGTEEDPAALLSAGLQCLVPDPEEREWLEPRLSVLLDIGSGPTYPREDLFAAWTTFFHRVSRDEEPVVLVVDDAQYADEGLLLFLEHLVAVASFPCFVLLLTRPGLLEANPGLATNRRTSVLHLDALAAQEMGRLLDGLVAGLSEEIRNALVARAEGVPLFAVETVRSLVDRDLVVPRGGEYVLAHPEGLDVDEIGAPASLQALIAARLDTLPAEQRLVLDRASVIGTYVSRHALAAICPEVDDLDGVLAALARLQLLRQESSRFSSEVGRYQFVQSAVRQVAHGSLSRRDRKAGHLAVVEVLEGESDGTGQYASIIAQHYLEALDAVPDDPDTDRLADAAVAHLRKAAIRAAGLGSPREAATHLTVALERCRDDQLAPELETELAQRLFETDDHAASMVHAERARDAFDARDDVLRAGLAAAVLSRAISFGSADNARAAEVAAERLTAVQELGDALVELKLIGALLSARMRMGADFRDLADDHVRLAEVVASEGEIAASYISLALYYMDLGAANMVQLLLESAAATGRRIHDPRLLCRALVNLNSTATSHDACRAVEYGEEAAQVIREIGDMGFGATTEANLLMALLVRGSWDRALQVIDEGRVTGVNASTAELVRARILTARGEELPASHTNVVIEGGGDPQSEACWTLVGAIEALVSGRPDAGRSAVAAATRGFDAAGLFDDFPVLWQVATDVALEAGDRQDLDKLLVLVEEQRGYRLPRALTAQLHRVRGLLAARDGAPAEQVEERLRSALEHAVTWGSVPTVARVQADLGRWLAAQGRADEAGVLLSAARQAFTELGATAWLVDLEGALVTPR